MTSFCVQGGRGGQKGPKTCVHTNSILPKMKLSEKPSKQTALNYPKKATKNIILEISCEAKFHANRLPNYLCLLAGCDCECYLVLTVTGSLALFHQHENVLASVGNFVLSLLFYLAPLMR